jgi:hypothetical protein
VLDRPRSTEGRAWLAWAALVLLLIQLAWSALHQWRHAGLRAALVLGGWIVCDRLVGGPTRAGAKRGGWRAALPVGVVAVLAASLFLADRIGNPPTLGALAIAAAAACASFFAPLARRRLRRLLPATIVAASVAGSWVIAGQSLGARWSPFDDHEIMLFLGRDARLPFGEIPQRLAETEVGRAGRDTRFRPSYYALRLVETAAWGDSPRLWYAARLVLFAATLALAASTLARAVGPVAAVVLVLYEVGQRFWGDIWCRLGPGETYAALGCALYANRFYHLATGARAGGPRDGRTRDWLWLLAGSLVAMGSKENLLVLAPLTAGLVGYRLLKRRAGAAALVTGALGLAFACAVAAAVAIGVARAGSDVYGRSVAPGYRSGLLRQGLAGFGGPVSALDAAAVVVLLAAVLHFRGSATARRCLRVAAGATAGLAALGLFYATQYAFYLGRQQTGMRYDFPGALAAPAALVVVAAAGLGLLRALGLPRRLVRGVEAGLVAGTVLVIAGRPLTDVRKICAANVDRTVRFTERIDRVAAALRSEPLVPLVVTCGQPADFEPAHAVARFLAVRGVTNPLHLRADALRPGTTAQDATLAAELRKIERQGGTGYSPFPAAAPGRCFEIRLGRAPATGCVDLGPLE